MLRTGRLLAAALSTLILAALSLASCGSGYSSDDAITFCDQEKVGLAQCFDSHVYSVCKACYEECGPDCNRGGTCPEQYECKDE